MTQLSPTPRSTLTRYRERAATDRQALYDLLDEAMICHVGLVLDGSPVVLPTGFGRDGDTLYFHGSTGSRNMRAAASGVDVCVTVTLLDGLVYARSLNNHSMNYRSAVVHGRAEAVTGREAKLRALRAITDHLTPGSWDHAREVNARELAGVTVLALSLAEASVKTRRGEPGDDQEDLGNHAVWAGVLPVRTTFGEPVPAAYHPAGAPIPDHVAGRAGRTQSRTGPLDGSR
ncbi:pyridoxamine 5'-phosphate oxidase family protein [Amycolatopsis rhizosphaerae]|uniref:Pyridoxamine 5'-phosphate oxidase family protein n=1 Tax=Amycolatopsis rhizosphaerae TaxID=2053003 RepID=A0A558B8G2_9PSEU|nr:pyridoxamine 5'-phosphate oxidase family protein [Amycolatopsis rhizosphaerae]TVT32788.1 pyridoxamine 5'-phosphate oxidase family protein [Amycolatopsis rhizosphaerae]